MITVGVDLATEPAKTAMAVLRWSVTGAAVQSLVLDVDDAAITNAATDADKLGIDCPLGWPDDFLLFLQEHHAGHVVAPQDVAGRDWRRKLAYRATDRAVRETHRADSSECGGRPDRFDRHARCRDSVAPGGRRPPG